MVELGQAQVLVEAVLLHQLLVQVLPMLLVEMVMVVRLAVQILVMVVVVEMVAVALAVQVLLFYQSQLLAIQAQLQVHQQ